MEFLGKTTYSQNSLLQKIENELFVKNDLTLYVKREDKNFSTYRKFSQKYSGNKGRKLKYNLMEARRQGYETLLTFGGAYSNHLSAVAAAGADFGFKTVGVVRGESPRQLNPTLAFAESVGMRLEFVNRAFFAQKNEPDFLWRLQEKFGAFYLIPEGGTNCLALQGVAELAEEIQHEFEELPDWLCVPCGTGGTLAGLVSGMKSESRILGFPVLKGDFLKTEIEKLLQTCQIENFSNWHLNTEYHFGGYAKHTPELLQFMHEFYEHTRIPLDPIYTAKMFFGIFDLAKKGFFPKGATILAIHTGGLQGIEGFNQRFGTNLPVE